MKRKTYTIMDTLSQNQKMIISATMYGDNYTQLNMYLKPFKETDFFQDMLHFTLNEALSDDNAADARRVFNIVHALGINMQDHKNTGEALCQIVQKNQDSLLNRVLSTGANPDRANHQAKTPLYYAAMDKRNPQMVKSLIHAGANIYYPIHHDFCDNVFQMVDNVLDRKNQKKTAEVSVIIDLFNQAASAQAGGAIPERKNQQHVLKKHMSRKPTPLKRRRPS